MAGFALLIVLGLTVAVFAAVRPKMFWPMLILANMIGNGPRIYGYMFLDEVLTGSLILGALMRISLVNKPCQKTNEAKNSHHQILFIIWAGYMVMLSFVGMIALNDIRIVRWLLFYIALGLLSAIIYYRSEEFPFPPVRQAYLTILFGAIIAFGSYLIQGMTFEYIAGLGELGRFDSQETYWSGSAYAIFPIVLGMPAVLYLIDDESPKVRKLVVGTLLLFVIIAFYYLSRSVWIALGLFIAISLKKFNAKRILLGALVFILLFVVFVPDPIENIDPFIHDITDTITMFTPHPDDSDLTRNLQLRALWMTLQDNLITAITGSGIYTNRVRIIPHIVKLHEEHLSTEYAKSLVGAGGVPLDVDLRDITVYRTTGLPALVIDTGFIGMILFGLLFIMTAHKLILRKNKELYIHLMVLFIAFNWLMISNILDIILFYMLIMPNGIIEQLSKRSSALSDLMEKQ